jgi:Flp pilus assembly pilin Flp
MNLLKRLWLQEDGQGLVEYTFVVVLAALVFWMGVRDTEVADSLARLWAKVFDCVISPFSCAA